VTESDLWRAGDLHIEQDWARALPWPEPGETVAPIGYKPPQKTDADPLVPIYSPGLPLIMAAVHAIAGYAAVFWIVPCFGGLFVICAYGIGRHFGGPVIGVASAFLTALSPIVLFMVLWPMSDIVVSAVWAAATWAVLGPSRRRALAGGVLAGAAIVIRPNLVAVGLLMGVWTIARDWKERHRESFPNEPSRKRLPVSLFARAALFALGAIPGVLFVMQFNRALYESPFVSGYGTLASVLHLRNFAYNVTSYATWLFQSETPFAAIGLVPLALPLARVWRGRDRAFDAALFSLIALGTLSCYLFFMPLDEWWYVRFMMPVWPGLFAGLSIAVLSHRSRARVAIGALLIVAIGAHGVWFAKQRRITAASEGERRFVSAAELVREHTEPNSIIFSFVHSGSVRYYGERMTFRYDKLAPEWLDPAVAYFSARGAHPYLLVEDWELDIWRDRFAATSALGRMDMGVVFELHWPTPMWLFDLTKPKSAPWPVINGFYRPRPSRTPLPTPPPVFVLRAPGR
jgi:hypothetical protein